MDANTYAHKVAVYMGQLFDFRLAKITSHPLLPHKPQPPAFIAADVLDGCSHAVDICIKAFTHPCMFSLIHRQRTC